MANRLNFATAIELTV